MATVLLSALQHIFAGLKRSRDQKLSSGLMSGQLNLASLFHRRGTCAVITQLTPRTYCRLPWHVVAWGAAQGFRRGRRGPPHVLQVLFRSSVEQS